MGAVVEPGVVLDRVVELASDAPVQAFARAYLRRPAGHGEDDADPQALLAEILGAYGLAANRTGPVAVRAFTPSRTEHGYDTGGSVLETNTEDLPFLVDSVAAEIGARGYAVRRLTHPIIGIERDERQRIVRVVHPREASARESVMHFELDRRLSPEELVALEDGVRGVLDTVREVVHAFPGLVERLDRMAELVRDAEGVSEAERADSLAFLGWLRADHFVFLGYQEAGDQIGLACEDAPKRGDELVTVSKTNRLSPVHRRERMDAITVGDARLLRSEERRV